MAQKVFTLRMEEQLLEAVKTSAEANKRSMAKEIEYILEQYYNSASLPLARTREIKQPLD